MPAGTRRPRLRQFVTAFVVALWGFAPVASAADSSRCRWLDSLYSDQFEWLDRDQPRGIRLVATNDDWSLGYGVDVPLGIGCGKCKDGNHMGGRVFLHLEDSDAVALEGKLSAEALASGLSENAPKHLPVPDEMRVELHGAPNPVSVFGVKGLAVPLTVHVRSWSTREMPPNWSSPDFIAVGFQEGCFSLVAVLAADSNLALEDIGLLSSAFRLERYQPLLPLARVPVAPSRPLPSSGGVWDLLQDRMTKKPSN